MPSFPENMLQRGFLRGVTGGSSPYLLDFRNANFTRASEAAAVDPRVGADWAFYDLTTPWPGVNVPRILPDGSVLLEGARTNYNPNSENYSGYLVSGTPTLTPNQSAPDGTTNAYRIAYNAVENFYQPLAVLPDNQIFRATWYLRNNGGASGVIHYVNSKAGALLNNTPALTNLWVRGGLAGNSQSGASTMYQQLHSPDATIRDHFAWGAQVEVGTFPSSLIRTLGASATRAADLLSFASIPDRMRSGRWRQRVTPLHNGSINGVIIAQGVVGNDEILFNASTGRISVTVGGVVMVSSNVLTLTALAPIDITLDAAAGSINVQGAAAGNGVVVGTPWIFPQATTNFGSRSTGTAPLFAVFSRPEAA